MFEINKIYNVDCLIGMKEIQSGSIDMILCDLPYGTTRNKWDIIIPFEPLWEQYERIIKDNGAIVLTAAQPFTTDLINSNKKLFRYDLIWYKSLGTGFLNANKMPMRNHEHILIFYKNVPTYNPIMTKGKLRQKGNKGASTQEGCYGKYKATQSYNDLYFPQSVIEISNGDNTKENQHSTQKPVKLFEYLILTYSNEGDLIFDNCIGSGTTAEAAYNHKRNFIGFEIDKDYSTAAQKRMDAVMAQITMF